MVVHSIFLLFTYKFQLRCSLYSLYTLSIKLLFCILTSIQVITGSNRTMSVYLQLF